MKIPEYSLDGRLAVVTGGGTGIGRAIAACLAEAGAKVVITGRNMGTLEESAESIPGDVHPIVHDVCKLESHSRFVNDVENRFGAIHTLVNNAGTHHKIDTREVSDSQFESVLLTNAQGLFALTREVGKRMLSRMDGDIQMISSMAAIFGIPKVAAYALSKGGITALARQLAVEWGPAGVRVNVIAPGFVETAMSRKALDSDPERKAKVLGRTPLGRFGQTREIGLVSAFLASPAASYITGATIPVDGGTSIGF